VLFAFANKGTLRNGKRDWRSSVEKGFDGRSAHDAISLAIDTATLGIFNL
jgi:hypothetical protein